MEYMGIETMLDQILLRSLMIEVDFDATLVGKYQWS
jgi:hypothetical protein